MLLLVAVAVLGLVVTLIQGVPQARADVVNGVTVSQDSATAQIKDGTTSVCRVTDRASFDGGSSGVQQFIDAVSQTARTDGFSVDENGINPAPGQASEDLALSFDVDLAQFNLPASDCSTALDLTPYRGRGTLSVPPALRGLIAGAAGAAVYLAVTFAVVALFAFLAPEFIIAGELVGGCIAGFGSLSVMNYIQGVPVASNLTSAAVECIAGALVNVASGTVATQIRTTINGWLGRGSLGGAAGTGVAEAAGDSSSISSVASQAGIELAAALPAP
jgi:hypothetical protein